ncbi:MAG: redoxin family protein [Paramuribaculum sp.]|nr:redoxin family protein [Paramuribaculum sp.]
MSLRITFTSLLLSVALPFCVSASGKNEAVLKVSVKNLGERELSYFRSYSGVYVNESNPVVLDSDSTFTIYLPTDGVEYISLKAKDPAKKLPDLSQSMFLMPGTAELVIDPLAKEVFQINPEAGGMDNFSLAEDTKNLSNIYFSLIAFGMLPDELNITPDSIPSVVLGKLDNYIDSINTRYENAAPWLLDAYNGMATFYKDIIFVSKYRHFAGNEEWDKTYKELIKNINVSTPSSGLFPYWQMLAVNLLSLEKGDSLAQLSGNEFLLLQAEYCDSVFSGKATEAALGTLLLEDGHRGLYNLGAIALTQQFKDKYPNSSLIPLLDEQASRNIVFNNPPEREGINFRDNSEIATVADILAPYKGKPVLVDLWATWCRPCLQSFTHVEPVQKYAAEKGIQLLYISIDDQNDIEKKWRNVALLNNLIGDHLLINPTVKMDIYETFGHNSSMWIPQYAFVAPDGTITLLDGSLAESEDFSPLKEKLDELLK